MSIDAIKAVVDLIEMGGVVGQEDIVKCLRSAIEQAERPYADKAALLNSDRLRIDPVTGNVGIGSVTQAERQELVCEYCGGDRFIAPPQRQPLTEEEIVQVLGNVRESVSGNVFLAFAHAIERAHGIGGGR